MTLLAQAAIPGDWSVIIAQSGLAGIVIAWFMWRTEGRLKATERAIDRMARASLLLVIGLHQTNESTKGEARKIITEIGDEQKDDK